MEVNIGPYKDILINLAGDFLKTLAGTSNCDTNRTVWECPQDFTWGRPQRPKDVGRGRPHDVGRGRLLVLDKGPYRDAHRTSFRDVSSTSKGRNLDEWGILFMR